MSDADILTPSAQDAEDERPGGLLIQSVVMAAEIIEALAAAG